MIQSLLPVFNKDYAYLRYNSFYIKIIVIIFLFVNVSVCVRLLSDSTSQWTPLPFTNSSYYQACNGLSPLSCCPCQAH
ncbi:hypothetical protein C5L27_11910 [Staphylococcus argenteus]|nr:hypothetical protein CKO49_10250 [Staphylococcus argenteus]KAA0798440.1 hypothetical protein DVU64_11950 [Staphylococcus argenteus]MZG26739.1 hypothetical protein [Staphylococcus argenteus]PSJ09172.1 hypothetical protein C7K56_11755 [Staphylococcus argenteus]RRT86679.1 hypothetical protein DPF86_12785 [Staphylococcus argenteus]